MSLLSPGFLLGLLAVGLPVWLHLLNQSDPRTRRFSATFLLEPAEISAATERRLRYRLLLGARLAALVLLALLFSEPAWKVAADSSLGASDRSVTVIVDQSLSMTANDRFELALGNAREAIAALPEDVPVQVVAAGNGLSLITGAETSRADALAALNSLKPRAGAVDYGAAMRALPQLVTLHGAASPVRDEVVFVSDLQVTNMPVRFADLVPRDVEHLTVVPVAEGAIANWRVSATVEDDVVTATLTGFHSPEADLTVTVRMGEDTVRSTTLTVPANGSVATHFAGLPLRTGQNGIEVAIDAPDAIAADNTWFQVVVHNQPLNVLVIAASAGLEDAVFINTALAAISSPSLAVRTIAPDGEWPTYDQPPGLIIVTDAAALDEANVARLAGYLDKGGALLMAAGPRSAVQATLPVTGHTRVDTGTVLGQDALEGHRLGSNAAHPALPAGDLLGRIRVFRWVPLAPLAGDEVLVTLDNGVPWMIEHKQGNGRVLLLATPFDGTWSELAIDPLFVPLVRSALGYLAGVDAIPAQGEAGLTLQISDVSAAASRAVIGQVLDPSGRAMASLSEAARGTAVTLNEPGIYALRTRGGERLLAINAPAAESDIASLDAATQARWQQAVNNAGAVPGDGTEATAASVSAGPAREVTLTRWLLPLLTLIFVMEVWLGNRHLVVRTARSV
ncbi:MAG: BatA domain-containing protein [Gammaproteobacteria bacterium]|nr:BatA domain-containing protein [Gammaproteobacteria bacterium]